MSKEEKGSSGAAEGARRATGASFYASRQRARRVLSLRRRGPKPRWNDEQLLAAIQALIAASPFHGEGYRKLWAPLRAGQVRTSPGRVLRLMRAAQLLSPHRLPQAPPRQHAGVITTTEPNLMWGTDMTLTATTDEGQVCVFAAIEHFNSECVGIHASKRGDRFEALEPLRQGVREQFGAFGAGVAAGLNLRHDHGSQYMSDHFQGEIAFLGMTSSPAFVRQPEGNGCIERFFRTLKEQLLWVRHFRNVEELRLALVEFRHRYNHDWLIGRLGYRSPLTACNCPQAAAAAA
ncbi:MAG: transposase [Terriglobales bacterium]